YYCLAGERGVSVGYCGSFFQVMRDLVNENQGRLICQNVLELLDAGGETVLIVTLHGLVGLGSELVCDLSPESSGSRIRVCSNYGKYTAIGRELQVWKFFC